MWIEPWGPREARERSASIHDSILSSDMTLGGTTLSDEETFSTPGTVGIGIRLNDVNEGSWQGLSPRPETPCVDSRLGIFPYQRLGP